MPGQCVHTDTALQNDHRRCSQRKAKKESGQSPQHAKRPSETSGTSCLCNLPNILSPQGNMYSHLRAWLHCKGEFTEGKGHATSLSPVPANCCAIWMLGGGQEESLRVSPASPGQTRSWLMPLSSSPDLNVRHTKAECNS